MNGFEVIEEGPPSSPPSPGPGRRKQGKKTLPKGTFAFEIHRCLKRPARFVPVLVSR